MWQRPLVAVIISYISLYREEVGGGLMGQRNIALTQEAAVHFLFPTDSPCFF